jgi:arylsulfatase A-like enzyme
MSDLNIKTAACITAIFSLLFVSCSKNQDTSDLPNFVILFVDDLGYYDLGFRNPDYYSPNIDRLAGESLIFINAYVPSPTCSPSRVGLYTGKHPASIGFYRHCFGSGEFNMFKTDVAKLPSRNWLPLENVTYAEVLKEKGYSTFFCGKWHLGPEEYGPQNQGFETAWTNPESGNPSNYYPPYFGNGKFSDEADSNQYLTDFFTDKAVEFIRSGADNTPFLLQFSYHNVHAPNIGKKEFLDMYRKNGFTGKKIEYGAQVTAVDQSVGRILKALEERDLEDNTVVMFMSDQGSLFPNTPLRGTKAVGTALYEGSAKIPFFIKWNGVTEAGSVEEDHIQTTDVFPTLVEIVGGDPSQYIGLEGVSLLGLIKSKQKLEREALYFYRSYDGQYASVLRKDNWKLIAYRDGHYELFKVDEDISETEELSALKPEIVKELAEMLHKWESKFGILQ